MILIGNSRAPWECDQKGLTQAYQKMIYLPKPDYSYRSCSVMLACCSLTMDLIF